MGQEIGYPPRKVWSRHEGMALAAQDGRHSAGNSTDGFGVTPRLQGQRKPLVLWAVLNSVQSHMVGRTVLPVHEGSQEAEERTGKAGPLRLPKVSGFPTGIVTGHMGRRNCDM